MDIVAGKEAGQGMRDYGVSGGCVVYDPITVQPVRKRGRILISARTKSPLIDKAARAEAFCFFWNRISFLLALQFQWPNIYDLFHVFYYFKCYVNHKYLAIYKGNFDILWKKKQKAFALTKNSGFSFRH